MRMREYNRMGVDLEFALGARVKILAPLAGKAGEIGVEVARNDRRIEHLAAMPPPIEPLSFPLGPDMDGNPIFCNLAESPHLGILGETGSGKSAAINAMLCSFLSRFGPDELGLVLIDPKQVELAPYEGISQLLAPIATDVDSALARLRSTVKLMEMRYDVMQKFSARSLPEFNTKLEAAGYAPCPYIVVVIDELADLMMSSRKESESLIVRLAQKSRAVGIHLVLATQSPRVQIFTGLLKANIPSRICFRVSSMTDSRVALDKNGAEALLGNGDGLFSMGGAPCVRFQGAFVNSAEIQTICDRWRS
jgi:S-DNA-T family DNA segregation ATPase FtsK/SpoIIIE